MNKFYNFEKTTKEIIQVWASSPKEAQELADKGIFHDGGINKKTLKLKYLGTKCPCCKRMDCPGITKGKKNDNSNINNNNR